MNEFDNQILWLATVIGDKTYYITSSKIRDMYYLWQDKKGKPVQKKYQSNDPTNLYKYCKEWFNGNNIWYTVSD